MKTNNNTQLNASPTTFASPTISSACRQSNSHNNNKLIVIMTNHDVSNDISNNTNNSNNIYC